MTKMEWKPISQAEFEELVATERSTLDPNERAKLERYAVPPVRVFRIFKFGSGEPDPVWVVARDGSDVLFYDDTEEEFGTATLDPDGPMRDWSTFGKLAWALHAFPSPPDARSG